MSRLSKLRASARGERCTLQFMDVYDHDPETVVLAHLREISPAGMSQKPDDLCAVYACFGCHQLLHSGNLPTSAWWDIARALVRTHQRMVDKGLL